MATDDTHGLGYELVDDDPNVSVLVATMDTTARWEATRQLRSWERRELGLGGGQRLLDVGCGLGEAALALANDLGDDGEVVGVDVSAEMLRVAQSKAGAARCRVRFTVGDACSLAEPDNSFDVVRSERTLQWLIDRLTPVAKAEATHTWTAWNPDESPAPDGCFSMQSLADDLVATDQLAPAERDRFVSRIQQAARRDRFSMNLTMYAVVAAAPTP